MFTRRRTAALILTLLAGSAAASGLRDALPGQRLGLLPADTFRLSDGGCADCPTIRQGLWYFRGQVLAVPHKGMPVSGFKPGSSIVEDVAGWYASAEAQTLAHPGLVWLGAPQLLDNAALLPDGRALRLPGGDTLDLQLVSKIPSNQSYWNGATTDYFAQRPLRMRGGIKQVGERRVFEARTVWPKDFVIDGAAMQPQPLAAGETLASFVRAEGGGAASGYATRLLWERTPGKARQWQDKPVLGVMLNGAQGDDDEAFGGHFAIATGVLGPRGEWADWLVNNFYNLDSVSEKGIIAAPVPMDNYLMDLNSGQQYYRPSVMLVAVLNNGRTAAAYQGGVQRVFNNFYRHDFTYQHAASNCTGISMDVFTGLGWQIPQRGATSNLKALAAYAYVSATDLSLVNGRKVYDYLTEEQVRLYPAVGFEAAGEDLLRLVGAAQGKQRALTAYEQQLQSDVEAIVLVRIPQVPSSRAMGSAPVFSFDEFMARTPADRSKWKIVPTPPRPFPAALRDGELVSDTPSPVPLPAAGLAMGGLLGIGAFVRRRRQRGKQAGRAD